MLIASEQNPSVPESSKVLFTRTPVWLFFIRQKDNPSASVALELIFTTSFIFGLVLLVAIVIDGIVSVIAIVFIDVVTELPRVSLAQKP